MILADHARNGLRDEARYRWVPGRPHALICPNRLTGLAVRRPIVQLRDRGKVAAVHGWGT